MKSSEDPESLSVRLWASVVNGEPSCVFAGSAFVKSFCVIEKPCGSAAAGDGFEALLMNLRASTIDLSIDTWSGPVIGPRRPRPSRTCRRRRSR